MSEKAHIHQPIESTTQYQNRALRENVNNTLYEYFYYYIVY